MADKLRANNPRLDGHRILLGCHRGDRAHFPENTMPAFRAAVELGLDAIETDVRMTKDGHLVLIHDRDVERTTNGKGLVDEMTLAEIKALDAGFWKGKEFKGVQIPTVEEFLELVSPTHTVINWELKEYPMDFGRERAFATIDKLASLLDQYGMAEKSIMNSFSEQNLEYCAEKWPGKFVLHGYLDYIRPKDHAARPQESFLDWAAIWRKDEEQPAGFAEDYAYAAEQEILPCILVPDTEEMYQKALDLGCRMFTSDDPAAAQSILRRLGAI
ncbi:MAG: hypothetical protein IJ043_04835 [Clostridia bacterium]|nr:hypothetical protein [Clostridia bacterium]